MKTFVNVICSALLLALVAVAQAAPQTSGTPAWSQSWSPQAVGSGMRPVDSGSKPAQPNAGLPVVPTSAGGQSGNNNPMATTATVGPVNLGPGDLVDISIFDSPELATRVRVTSDGEISFPLLGKLHVGGMTPQQVQSLIRDRLVSGDLVKDPQVAVFVAEYTNQGVFMLGEVAHPGVYPLIGSHQLFDFISAAGGFTPIAGKSIVITRRGEPVKQEVVRFEREPNLAVQNPDIEAGDTIYVRRAGVIFVVGDVVKPGGYLMDSDENMTVMQAVANALGAKPTAALSSARLIRTTAHGREEITFDLKKVFQLKGRDPVLHDQDIVYVPRNTAKVAFESFLNYGVTAAVSASIYKF